MGNRFGPPRYSWRSFTNELTGPFRPIDEALLTGAAYAYPCRLELSYISNQPIEPYVTIIGKRPPSLDLS